jgi:hypothetical protein
MSIATTRLGRSRQHAVNIPSARRLRHAAQRRHFREPQWLLTFRDKSGREIHVTRPLHRRQPRIRRNCTLVGFAVIDVSDKSTKSRVRAWVSGCKQGLYHRNGTPKRDEFITIKRPIVPFIAATDV